MPQRSVASNYTFEQQRTEINLLAADFWTQKTNVDNASSTYLKHNGSNDFTGGTLNVPSAFTISPDSGNGTLTISGNLTVTGTTTTVNTATLDVTDKNITIAKGSTSDANSDGAGITIDSGTDITWNFVDAKDAWVSSIGVEATTFLKGPYGQFTGSGTPTTGYGVEVNAPDENTGQITSYHRGNSAYKDLRIKGSSVGVYTGTTNALEATFNSTGLSVEGITTAKSGLVVGSANQTKAQDGVIIERNSSSGIAHISAGRSGGNYSGFEFYVAGLNGVTKRLSLDYQGNQQFYKEDGSTSQFYIKHDGKVGIGVTSLTAQLTISGASQAMASEGTLKIQAPANGADVGGGITFGNDLARRAAIVGKQEGTDAIAGYLAFGTRGSSGDVTERLRIDKDGRIGIGTQSPQDYLDLGNATGGRGIAWGGSSGTSHYNTIWSEYSSGSLVIGAGLRGSTSDTDFHAPWTGTMGYAAIELDSFSDDGIKFYTAADAAKTEGDVVTKEERARITTSGELQVSTNKASGYVAEFNQNHTSNSAQIRINSPTDSNTRPSLIDFSRAGTTKWSTGMGYNDSYNGYHICMGASLSSGTANSKFVVTSDGYTGIGNYAGAATDPVTSLLHVCTNWDNGGVPMVHFKGANNEAPTNGDAGGNISFQISDENSNVLHKVWNDASTTYNNNNLGKVFYAGRMGIGVDPSHPLHIKTQNGSGDEVVKIESESGYDARLQLDTSNGGGAGAHLDFQMDGTTVGGIEYINSNSSPALNTMIFRTAGNSERMRIGTNGVITNKVGSYGHYSRPLLEITAGGTPTQCKILTKIPWTGDSSHAHSVRISGFRYASAQAVDLQICWHVYNNSFYNRTVSSSGAWAPPITLAVENGFVVIHLLGPGYWPKFYVESLYHAFGSPEQGQGWSWTDAAINGDSGLPVETVPYKSHFGNGTTISGESNGETNMYITGSNSTLGARLILKNTDTTANCYNDLSFCDAGGQSTSIVRGINHNDANNEGYLEFHCRPSGGLPTKWMDITATGELRTFVSSGKESHNYCKRFQWGGYAQCSATWSVSIPNLNQGNIYRIIAAHSHHNISMSSYIDGIYSAYSGHSGLQIDTDFHESNNSVGGTWDVTRGGTNGDPLVITHTGGTYNGYGHWFIWVLSGTT